MDAREEEEYESVSDEENGGGGAGYFGIDPYAVSNDQKRIIGLSSHLFTESDDNRPRIDTSIQNYESEEGGSFTDKNDKLTKSEARMDSRLDIII